MNKEGVYLEEEKRQVVWTIPIDKAKEDELTWNMLQNNMIEGFLEFEYYCIDDKMSLCYSYQNLQSVSAYLEKKKADFSFFQFFFENLAAIMESGDSFLLPKQGYLLDMEMIFLDHMNKQVKLCYLPGNKACMEQDMIRLAENLLEKADHHSEKGVRFIYGLYDMFVTEGFCVERLSQFLKDFSREDFTKEDDAASETDSDHVTKEVLHSDLQNDTGFDQAKNRTCKDQFQKQAGQPRKNVFYHQKEKKGSKKLDSPDEIRFQLQYVPSYKRNKKTFFSFLKKRNKKSLVDFFVMACKLERYESCLDEICIGRDQDCDCSIAWERISMQHAHVGMEKNQFYVMDMDSAYGTYINGQKISAFVKTICNTGDILTFADISYQLCRN